MSSFKEVHDIFSYGSNVGLFWDSVQRNSHSESSQNVPKDSICQAINSGAALDFWSGWYSSIHNSAFFILTFFPLVHMPLQKIRHPGWNNKEISLYTFMKKKTRILLAICLIMKMNSRQPPPMPSFGYNNEWKDVVDTITLLDVITRIWNC